MARHCCAKRNDPETAAGSAPLAFVQDDAAQRTIVSVFCVDALPQHTLGELVHLKLAAETRIISGAHCAFAGITVECGTALDV